MDRKLECSVRQRLGVPETDRRWSNAQGNVPGGAVETIHGDLIGLTSDGIKNNRAGQHIVGFVIITGDDREVVERGTGINGEYGVEVAATGRNPNGICHGRGPSPPDGGIARCVGMIGLCWLAGGFHI